MESNNKYICSVYRLPNSPQDNNIFNDINQTLVQLALGQGDKLIVLGDFNIHNSEWLEHSYQTDETGIECEMFAATWNLTQIHLT